MSIIEQIKAEIEKRIWREREVKDKYDSNTSSFVDGSIDALDGLLSFLSTLESEKSMNQDGLKEEIESYWKENGPMSHAEYDRLAKCARHFAQWGAEHLADARKTSPKDLEEAAREYGFEEYRRRCNGGEYGTSEDAFIAGAKWQKEQMMKDAVEGHIVSKNDGWNSIELPSTFFGELSKNYKDGDKIKVIIVKEEN